MFKIAFIFGPFVLGKFPHFDLSNLWTDSRGLTGSELSFFRYAQEMVKLGHNVHLFTFYRGEILKQWDGMQVHHFNDIGGFDFSDFDAVFSWNEPDVLRSIPKHILRIVNLQINSFVHCRPGFEEFVDVWTSPSESHRQRILQIHHHDPNKWVVLYNGCNPEQYDPELKIPGRVIWASSPDRGLHWLLQEWSKIKKAVPHAHLRIFYNVKLWINAILNYDPNIPVDAEIEEYRNRAYYMNEALRRLENLGVELVDTVSREQITREMSEAEVLAYPCDTVSWTEGFSVTLMEACAAGIAPITFGVDALASIYGGHIPVIQPPVSNNIHKFTTTVIKTLIDPGYRKSITEPAQALAQAYQWKTLARVLERILGEKLDERRSSA